jgi:hypothetical protein
MRAHLSPILATSPFPAARTTAMDERPVASRITPSHGAHGSNSIALTPPPGNQIPLPAMLPSTTDTEIVRSRTAPGAVDT